MSTPTAIWKQKNDIAEAKATEKAHAVSCILSVPDIHEKDEQSELVIMAYTCKFQIHPQTKTDKTKQGSVSEQMSMV